MRLVWCHRSYLSKDYNAIFGFRNFIKITSRDPQRSTTVQINRSVQTVLDGNIKKFFLKQWKGMLKELMTAF